MDTCHDNDLDFFQLVFEMTKHYQILCGQLAFAVDVKDEYVIAAAPVAKWMIGKAWLSMVIYWTKRNAEIITLNV